MWNLSPYGFANLPNMGRVPLGIVIKWDMGLNFL
jgi:hypothetical protein